MLQSLQKRFARMETKCLVQATLLDPRYKGHDLQCSAHTDQGKTMDKRRACHCVRATENNHHWRPSIRSETEKSGRWRITWSLPCSWTNVCKHIGASWNSYSGEWWWAAGSVPPRAIDWQTDWSATGIVETEYIPPTPSCTTGKEMSLSTLLLCSQRESI